MLTGFVVSFHEATTMLPVVQNASVTVWAAAPPATAACATDFIAKPWSATKPPVPLAFNKLPEVNGVAVAPTRNLAAALPGSGRVKVEVCPIVPLLIIVLNAPPALIANNSRKPLPVVGG